MNISEKGDCDPRLDTLKQRAERVEKRKEKEKENFVIKVFKAQAINVFKSKDTIIEIREEWPGFEIETARQKFKKQAVMIADALFESLPGGTVDALLVEMLDRKRSDLIVSRETI